MKEEAGWKDEAERLDAKACGCGCGLVPCPICDGDHYVGRKCAGDRRLAKRRKGLEAHNFVHGHEMCSPTRVMGILLSAYRAYRRYLYRLAVRRWLKPRKRVNGLEHRGGPTGEKIVVPMRYGKDV